MFFHSYCVVVVEESMQAMQAALKALVALAPVLNEDDQEREDDDAVTAPNN